MSSTRSPNSIDSFAMDAFCMSMELHAVSEQDAPGIRAAAIRKGRRSYRALVQRRKLLCLSRDDASTAENMLKAIEARLEYLGSVSTFRRNQWRLKQRGETSMPESADMRWLWKGLPGWDCPRTTSLILSNIEVVSPGYSKASPSACQSETVLLLADKTSARCRSRTTGIRLRAHTDHENSERLRYSARGTVDAPSQGI